MLIQTQGLVIFMALFSALLQMQWGRCNVTAADGETQKWWIHRSAQRTLLRSLQTETSSGSSYPSFPNVLPYYPEFYHSISSFLFLFQQCSQHLANTLCGDAGMLTRFFLTLHLWNICSLKALCDHGCSLYMRILPAHLCLNCHSAPVIHYNTFPMVTIHFHKIAVTGVIVHFWNHCHQNDQNKYSTLYFYIWNVVWISQ